MPGLALSIINKFFTRKEIFGAQVLEVFDDFNSDGFSSFSSFWSVRIADFFTLRIRFADYVYSSISAYIFVSQIRIKSPSNSIILPASTAALKSSTLSKTDSK